MAGKQQDDDANIHTTLENVKVTSHYFTSLALSTNMWLRLYYLHGPNEDSEVWRREGASRDPFPVNNRV